MKTKIYCRWWISFLDKFKRKCMFPLASTQRKRKTPHNAKEVARRRWKFCLTLFIQKNKTGSVLVWSVYVTNISIMQSWKYKHIVNAYDDSLSLVRQLSLYLSFTIQFSIQHSLSLSICMCRYWESVKRVLYRLICLSIALWDYTKANVNVFRKRASSWSCARTHTAL